MYFRVGSIDVLFGECVLCNSTGLLLPQLPRQPLMLLLPLVCVLGSNAADMSGCLTVVLRAVTHCSRSSGEKSH